MMNEMQDLIYAGDMTTEAQTDILSVFPDATFEDASDYIHVGRFEVTVECDIDNWQLQMFLLGMFDISLHMQMWRMSEPDDYIAVMRKAVEIRKLEEQTE